MTSPNKSSINGDDGTPGFGVYVHWPFCAAKCPYCDFNSHVRHNRVDQSAYADALVREIDHMAARQPGKAVTSIFFGGGTPSLMEVTTVEKVIGAVRQAWDMAGEIEITLEANPQSVDAGRFEGYRRAGVNRVSLGVQSLDDAQLKFLGRLHDADEARRAIRLARDVFPRMSFDLIYARPNQTAHAWRAELEEAISLAADHLSLYQLTIEEGTPFFDLHRRGRLKVPDGDHAADLYELTQEVTEAAGLKAYEISNHARPGFESRHNLTYWRFGTWAGIGPGAHGRLDMNDGRHALATERHPETWLKRVAEQGHGIITDDVLSEEDTGDEYLLMALRLREGLDLARYERFSGAALEESHITELVDLGMIERHAKGRIRATPQGAMVLDAVIADLAG